MCVLGRGVLLFGATLVYSGPGIVRGAFPIPTTPCPLPLLPYTPRRVDEAAHEGKEQQREGRLPVSPSKSPTQASQSSLGGLR